MTSDLERLLNPRRVAVIGASAKPGKIGNVLVRNLLRSSTEVFPVNPHEEMIEGLRCHRSIGELEDEIDVAIIAVPAGSAPAEVRNAVDKGVPFVIVTSAGFSEIGEKGKRTEREMVEYATSHGTRVLGPNTLGLYSPKGNTDCLIISHERSPRPKRGPIGLISQSGSVQVSLQERASEMGIGVSYSVGLGNRADISELDLLEFFESDPDTRCIAIYLESFLDGRRFIELARRISRKKPIVMVKAGVTETGSRAASSHTGALARGSDAIIEGALRQACVIRALDDEELMDYSNALSLMPPPKGERVAYVGSAGGIGVMISDHVESDRYRPRLRMTRLSDDTRGVLRKTLNEFAPTDNPVDLTAGSTPAQYDAAVRAVLSDPGVDILILSIDLQPPMMDETVFQFIPEWIEMGKPIIGTSTGGGPIALSAVSRMQSLGMPSYPSLSRCVRAARALYQRSLLLRKVM